MSAKGPWKPLAPSVPRATEVQVPSPTPQVSAPWEGFSFPAYFVFLTRQTNADRKHSPKLGFFYEKNLHFKYVCGYRE